MAVSEGTSLSRTLGGSEENWTRSTAGGTGIAVFGIALKRHVESSVVEQAAKKVAENHALLRSHIILNAKGKLCFEVKPEPWARAIEELPWPTVVEENSSGILVFDEASKHFELSSALHQITTNELNTPFASAESGGYPLDIFQIHVYFEKHHQHTVIILRFHGGALDRQASTVVAHELLISLNAAVHGKDAVLASSSDCSGILASMEDLIPKGKASKGFLKKGLDAVGYAVNSVRNSILPFHPDFSAQKQLQPFRSEVLTYSLGIPGTEALLAACKKENTTYAAALSAAFLKATANVKELKEKKQDTFSFTSVLSCRRYFDPPLEDSVLGNYSAGLPQDEQIKESISFWDLARRISASTEKELSKSHHFTELSVLNMLFSQVLKHPNLTPNSSLRTALFSIFVDGPLKIPTEDLENLQLAGTFGPFASMHFIGPCFSVAETLHKGPDLSLSFIYPTPVFSRTQLADFVTSALDLVKVSTKGY